MTILPLTDEIINAKKVYHQKEDSTMKKLRRSRGWTQQELAYRTHLSVPMIQHYEQGTKNIPADRKRIIAKVLRCKISDL